MLVVDVLPTAAHVVLKFISWAREEVLGYVDRDDLPATARSVNHPLSSLNAHNIQVATGLRTAYGTLRSIPTDNFVRQS